MADRDIYRRVDLNRERRDDLAEAATCLREFNRQGKSELPSLVVERLAHALDDTVGEWDENSASETVRKADPGESVLGNEPEALAWALGVLA